VWRTAQAKALGQPAYCVFTDKTLLAIAEVRPDGAAELSSIPGVGARKLDKFGPDVLALCAGLEPGAEDDAEDGPEEGFADGPEEGSAEDLKSSAEEADK
jgi:DNA helicase-2/ATP-dependent DNA helicase PcrA